MPAYRIRLAEQITQQGTGDFTVDAASENEAAAVVAEAYRAALAAKSHLVTLPDGQARYLDPHEVVAVVATYLLLDDAAQVVRPLSPPLN